MFVSLFVRVSAYVSEDEPPLVCACLHACVRACVCACVRACVRVSVRLYVYV